MINSIYKYNIYILLYFFIIILYIFNLIIVENKAKKGRGVIVSLKKYIITGDILEVYEYSQYLKGKGGSNRTTEKSEDIEKSLLNYSNTNQRRRDTVRRLACCNFNSKYDKFFTLTFAENLQNVKECNVIFKNFIKRLKYRFKEIDIKYLAVIEFQKRGAVHYHVLSNIPYIRVEELQELWGSGFVYINAITHVDNIGAYIVKYMTKDNTDLRLQGLKAYQYSRNLKKPYKLINHDLKEFDILEKKILKKYDLSNKVPIYETIFDTEKLGSCEYKQYNFRRSTDERI